MLNTLKSKKLLRNRLTFDRKNHKVNRSFPVKATFFPFTAAHHILPALPRQLSWESAVFAQTGKTPGAAANSNEKSAAVAPILPERQN